MSSRSLVGLSAPAKLNLFLHVTGRRPDGYHTLQSVFMRIDWQDTLDFTLRKDATITRRDTGTTSPLPADDLCVRAAHTLQQATGCSMGADIVLHKSIPSEAGMGGGSSDAATTLIALNTLWNLKLDTQQLLTLALQLGADVPFFILGHDAWVEGIGERLTPIALPPARFLIIKPESGAPTGKIFSAPDLVRNTIPATLQDFVASTSPYIYGHNDLQPVASALCPEIQAALDCLADLGLQPRMTGSGSAVFAWLPQDFDAPAALQRVPQKNWKIRICSNLAVHPLLQCTA